MKRQRIYVDNSVIGGCFDEEFREASNKLREEFEQGIHLPVVSPVVEAEAKAKGSPAYVGDRYDWLVSLGAEVVPVVQDARSLTDGFINQQIVTPKYRSDALHMALGYAHEVDIVVSWNFKHIVHHDKIAAYNAVAQMHGYKPTAIHTPSEVIRYEGT